MSKPQPLKRPAAPLNVDQDDHTPDVFRPTERTRECDIQLTIRPALLPLRVLHVILPLEAAQAIEQEILNFAKAHGKVKFWAEERVPPSPAGQH
jgi:hypothetical protein